MFTNRVTGLQGAFREQEAQTIVLETVYHKGLRSKEAENHIFSKYLETLRSKVDDVTCIMELEGLLESKEIEVPKKDDSTCFGAFSTILHVQLDELNMILSANEDDGPILEISLTEEQRTELLVHVPLLPDVDVMLGTVVDSFHQKRV
ncbi:hypothetical protein R1sor_000357 [Riccia sorocarpa]|uniref:Uncharacterized protein n=1 Tax=Riccia sorocarpa TaxID=122646 RepID=A0ABD3GSW0_9MARC